MKKILVILSVLLFSSKGEMYAQQSLGIVNLKICPVDVTVFAHDGVSYTTCGAPLSSTVFTVPFGSCLLPDVSSLNGCSGTCAGPVSPCPYWSVVCSSSINADATTGIWDFANFDWGGGVVTHVVNPSGCATGSSSATVSTCSGKVTVTWTNYGSTYCEILIN